jgi:tubby-related protein 1
LDDDGEQNAKGAAKKKKKKKKKKTDDMGDADIQQDMAELERLREEEERIRLEEEELERQRHEAELRETEEQINRLNEQERLIEQQEKQLRLQEEEERRKEEQRQQLMEQARKKQEEMEEREEQKKANENPDEEEEEEAFLESAPKYYQPGIVPQAPLKPSQKDAYDAFINKLFNPYLPLEEQKELYMKPLPALIGQIQCTIERSRGGLDRLWPRYTLTLSQGNRYMLTGKKRTMNSTSNYMITIDQQKFMKDANGYLGKVRSNFLGTEFYIFDAKENPKKAPNKDDCRQ